MIIKDTDVVEDAGAGLVSITDLAGNTTYVFKAALALDDLRFRANEKRLW